MSNKILDAYKRIDERTFGDFSEFEEVVYNILMKHSTEDLHEVGKALGERISAALDDAFEVAPKSTKDKFKQMLVKGMK